MNKIKFLYDVITKMKNKEVITGTLKTESKKDNLNIFSFENEFEKNMTTGHTRAKINTEMDYEGKKIKHESNTDFNMPEFNGKMHHCFMKHMHSHSHGEDHKGIKFGPKEGLNKIAFAFGILSALKVDEVEDNLYKLSIDINEIPEDIKKSFHEKMKSEKLTQEDGSHQHHSMKGFHHHHFMKDFHSMDNLAIDLNIYINKDFEIEKILFDASGKQKDKLAVEHEMNTKAEITFTW